MDNPADDAPPLVAAPRHLRRRAFHEEISDALLVPGVEPLPLALTAAEGARREGQTSAVRRTPYQRKKLIALIGVIVVSLCIPALVLALILAG
ncbi:hypothetical protein AB4Y67_14745 [Arthrobacter sp. YAF17]|uniref:hypothetical protein n=1 Tax=Arthrobacter sp. YAF17 TaxID=3233077 RepID=UPI003F90C4F0